MSLGPWFACLMLAAWLPQAVFAQQLQFPTANRFLVDPPQPEKFYAPTPGKTWESGGFGCVRSEGGQMHEGIDILHLQHDRRGEPTDPILAAAPGAVAYLNRHAGLSNYGKYVILYHQAEGIPFYTLYAHLSQIDPNLQTGQIVTASYPIGVMGRTSNTRQPISKERAHLHFELGFFLNEQFPAWLEQRFPGQRNDHGFWNGRNLLAIDPARFYQQQRLLGDKFRFYDYLAQQPELCRVLVRKTQFPWLTRYSRFIQANPKTQQEPLAGYEMRLNFNGVPFELIPRAASEIEGKEEIQLLSVNEQEYQKNHCRGLVKRTGQRWQLAPAGQDLISLLTFTRY